MCTDSMREVSRIKKKLLRTNLMNRFRNNALHQIQNEKLKKKTRIDNTRWLCKKFASDIPRTVCIHLHYDIILFITNLCSRWYSCAHMNAGMCKNTSVWFTGWEKKAGEMIFELNILTDHTHSMCVYVCMLIRFIVNYWFRNSLMVIGMSLQNRI